MNPKVVKYHLFNLIKSLTKAEKKHFNLIFLGDESLNCRENNDFQYKTYATLYRGINKMSEYDEQSLLKLEPSINPAQIPNIKKVLYEKILSSLRNHQKFNTLDGILHEEFDYAKILFSKGLYEQSLRMLSKAKLKAEKFFNYNLMGSIIEFEKHIELFHVTQSKKNTPERLLEESKIISNLTSSISQKTSFAISMYGYFLDNGHCATESDKKKLKKFYQLKLTVLNKKNYGTVVERLYLFQAEAWYYFIGYDFVNYYKTCTKSINLFEQNSLLTISFPEIYFKVGHNYLQSLLYINNDEKYKETLNHLNIFYTQKVDALTNNVAVQAKYYLIVSELDYYILKADFTKALNHFKDIQDFIDNDFYQLEDFKQLLLYYKMACICFASGKVSESIEYLNMIVNNANQSIQIEIHIFARILKIVAHFELGNLSILHSLTTSLITYINRVKYSNKVIKEFYSFFNIRLNFRDKHDIINKFIILKDNLTQIAKNPFERKAFLYLDLLSWIESKIAKTSVEKIIKKKVQNKINRI